MTELHRNLSFGQVWKGFRSTVSIRQTLVGDVADRRSAGLAHRDPNGLKSVLQSWQIMALAISGIIGVTIWQSTGLVLHVAGPAGLLTAVSFVAITCICVMESLSEMMMLWPVSMGLYEYVRAFVDHDLAIVIALAYWFSWSSVFGTLVVAAANIATYWDAFRDSQMWQTLLFYIFCPVLMLVINCMGVSYYGWLEGIAGIMKLVFVLVGMIYLFVTSARVGSQYFDDNYQFNPANALNTASAVWLVVLTFTSLVIPIITYGFLGIESITITAFEARDSSALRFPSRYVAYLVSLLYFLTSIGQAHSVSWENLSLPKLHARSSEKPADPPETHAVTVLAAQAQGDTKLAAFFTGCMVFFCLSAANTALYISSRTLYGLTRSIGITSSKWYLRWLSVLGTTTPVSRVPGWALLCSAVSFCWLPFLYLNAGLSSQDVLVIFSTTGSSGTVMVWASQCVAYWRCWLWFRHHSRNGDLPTRYDRWAVRWDSSYMATFSYLQPFPAVLGLVCCLLIIFIFSTATWWNGKPNFRNVATAYAGPVILVLSYIALKIRNRRLWVVLHPVYNAPDGLCEVLNRLERSAQRVTPADMEAQELDEVDERPSHAHVNSV